MSAPDNMLPQAEGADWFIVLDPKENDPVFVYPASLGRHFGHEHIMDAQNAGGDRGAKARRWVVRPAYASQLSLPPGWSITAAPDLEPKALRIAAPGCRPGMLTVAGNHASLAYRLLHALGTALLDSSSRRT